MLKQFNLASRPGTFTDVYEIIVHLLLVQTQWPLWQQVLFGWAAGIEHLVEHSTVDLKIECSNTNAA